MNLSYDIHDDGENGNSFIDFYVEMKHNDGGNIEKVAQDSIKSNILTKKIFEHLENMVIMGWNFVKISFC